MPGPNPNGTILTSNDVGLGTYEMKVKGTYLVEDGPAKYVTSKFLFTSPEEEEAFMARNPRYRKGGFLELNDPGSVKAINSNGKTVNVPIRGRKIPSKSADQIQDGIMSEGGEIKPGQKPKVKSTVTKTKVAS